MKNSDFYKKKKAIAAIAKKHQLKLVLLYGSYAKGTATDESDVDLAVLGKTMIDFDQILELNNDFAEVFQRNDIDVKSLHKTNPFFRYQVTANSRLLYGSFYDYHSFQAYSYKDFMDSQDLLILKEKLVEKRMKTFNL